MRAVLCGVLVVACSCDFSGDYATYCGNTGNCGVQVRGSACFSQMSTSTPVPLQDVHGGDLLVVTVDRFAESPGTLTTLVDSLGASLQPAFDAKSAPNYWTQTFFAIVPDGGNDQVTASFSSSQFTDVFVTAIENADPTPKVDQAVTSQGASGVADPGSVTTTVPDEIVYATAIADVAVTSVASGFTVLQRCNGNMVAWRSGGAPAAYDPVFSVDGGFLTTAVTFR